MLAAAAAAQWDQPAPEELQMAWDCQTWNSLPESGGLLDQRAGDITRQNVALNIYNAFISRGRSDNHYEWSQANPRAMKIVAHIERLRIDHSS